MNILFNTFITIFIVLSASYFIGSFPSSLVISKGIYKIDVREYGSGNAGGTNVGRVIGKTASIYTIALDIIKTLLSVWSTYFIVNLLLKDAVYDFAYNNQHNFDFYCYLSGLSVCIGHSYPIYADFKGGKAFAPLIGFLVATNNFVFALGLSIFIIVQKTKHIVSLSSISTATSIFFISLILAVINFYFPNSLFLGGFIFGLDLHMNPSFFYFGTVALLSILTILRHKKNIIRLINKIEPVTKFKKKDEK